jgi:hypothetical protein
MSGEMIGRNHRNITRSHYHHRLSRNRCCPTVEVESAFYSDESSTSRCTRDTVVSFEVGYIKLRVRWKMELW